MCLWSYLTASAHGRYNIYLTHVYTGTHTHAHTHKCTHLNLNFMKDVIRRGSYWNLISGRKCIATWPWPTNCTYDEQTHPWGWVAGSYIQANPWVWGKGSDVYTLGMITWINFINFGGAGGLDVRVTIYDQKARALTFRSSGRSSTPYQQHCSDSDWFTNWLTVLCVCIMCACLVLYYVNQDLHESCNYCKCSISCGKIIWSINLYIIEPLQ